LTKEKYVVITNQEILFYLFITVYINEGDLTWLEKVRSIRECRFNEGKKKV